MRRVGCAHTCQTFRGTAHKKWGLASHFPAGPWQSSRTMGPPTLVWPPVEQQRTGGYLEARSRVLYGKEEGPFDMCPLKLEVHRNMEPDAQQNLEILVESNVMCLGGKCRGLSPSNSAQSSGGRSGSQHSCFVRGSFPSSGAHNLEKGLVVWPLTRPRGCRAHVCKDGGGGKGAAPRNYTSRSAETISTETTPAERICLDPGNPGSNNPVKSSQPPPSLLLASNSRGTKSLKREEKVSQNQHTHIYTQTHSLQIREGEGGYTLNQV